MVRKEIQKVFAAGSGIERLFFPKKSGEVPDRPVQTMLVMAPPLTMVTRYLKTLLPLRRMTGIV